MEMRCLIFFSPVFPVLLKALVWDQVIELQRHYEAAVLYQRHYIWYHHIGIESLYFASTL